MADVRQTEFLHLAGVLMENFLERIAPLRLWYINPNVKSNKYKSALLSELSKALTEHFPQGNVTLRRAPNILLPHYLKQIPFFITVFSFA